MRVNPANPLKANAVLSDLSNPRVAPNETQRFADTFVHLLRLHRSGLIAIGYFGGTHQNDKAAA